MFRTALSGRGLDDAAWEILKRAEAVAPERAACVRILQQLLVLDDLRDDVFVLAERLDERLHLRDRLRVGAELRVVGLDGRIRHLGCQLLVSVLYRCQLVKHL